MNAIIMAAGMSSRFAPLSYVLPKGLLRVRGEILIERQIRQLQEAGITDITLVVGYMKEMFFYLEEEFGVKIVVNEDYSKYNNTSSLFRVLDKLDETFICSSDNYFTENVFLDRPRSGYYAAVYAQGKTDEYCLAVDGNDFITGVTIGGHDSWIMKGHVYFDHEFSLKFKELLRTEYECEETRLQLWEDFYMRHLDLLKLKIKRYPEGVIQEFDTLGELREFDKRYACSVDTKVLRNVCEILGCKESDVCDIKAVKQGLTDMSSFFAADNPRLKKIVFIEQIGGMSNKNFRVDYQGCSYVLRVPGVGSEGMVERHNEGYNSLVASDLGINPTVRYFNASTGIKLADYMDEAETLNAASIQRHDNLDKVVEIYRTLHGSNVQLAGEFNIFREIEKYDRLLANVGAAMYEGWPAIRERVMALEPLLDKLGVDLHPCHNDAVAENFLKAKDGTIWLIDWEYSGMNDRSADLAALFLENNFSRENEDYLLMKYFDGEIPAGVRFKIKCYQVLWDCLWAQWTVIKEAGGDDFGTYGQDRYSRACRALEDIK